MAKTRLGNAYEALSGRIGNNVASYEQDGTSLRAYNPISKQPNTPSQLARQAAFTKANQTWTTLDDETVEKWTTYSRGLKKVNPLTKRSKNRNPKNVFSGLYAKLLQVSATSPLPQIPEGNYVGLPTAIDLTAGTGSLTWHGAASTPVGHLLECRAQKLPSRTAMPVPDGYVTMAIAPLELAEGNEITVSVLPGHWACSFRWVNAHTGQETPEVALGKASVTLAVQAGGAADADETRKAA